MALKSIRAILSVSLLLVFSLTFIRVDGARALSGSQESGEPPALQSFIRQVTNGQAAELRGLYIPGILAAPVIAQPAGDHGFVSPRQNIVTKFSLASQFGSTGLLAHNYLAGENLDLLRKDQVLHLIYGDGQVSTFVITEIRRYQALEPDSTTSQFLDLKNNDLLTTPELFSAVYDRPGDLILQTCISKDGELSWGRLFVIAEPYVALP